MMATLDNLITEAVRLQRVAQKHETLAKRARHNRDQVIVRAVRAGARVYPLAHLLGLTPEVVYRALREHGVHGANRVTLAAVAKRAGVHVNTARRVFQGLATPDTERRVKAAAETLGYQSLWDEYKGESDGNG